jgi:hypothetical protein
MPFYVCERTCQVIKEINGREKPVTYEAGAVDEFEERPDHFRTLDGPVDFTSASEEELLVSKWTFAEAKKAMQTHYKANITKEKNTTKKELVNTILDIRARNVEFKPQA